MSVRPPAASRKKPAARAQRYTPNGTPIVNGARIDTRAFDTLSNLVTITFDVHRDHAPALRAAIEEISNEVGQRLCGAHKFLREEALTRAAIALGRLRAAVCRVVHYGDRDYE